MSLIAAVGTSKDQDAFQAGMQAAASAIKRFRNTPVGLGMLIATPNYQVNQLYQGISSILGEIPIFGFSASAGLSDAGQSQPAVVLGLMGGPSLDVKAGWWSAEEAKIQEGEIVAKIQQVFRLDEAEGVLLLAGDGLSNTTGGIVFLLKEILKNTGGDLHVAGCFAGGRVDPVRTFVTGGSLSGSRGLAGALLSGKIAIFTAAGHGWGRVGAYFKITGTSPTSILTLDDQPPNEIYAGIFGGTAKEWLEKPLNQLVRLYPFGLELQSSGEEHNQPSGSANRSTICSPIRIESGGSLLVNSALAHKQAAHLMVGSPSACLDAARSAARQALQKFEANNQIAKPALALLLVDEAWKMLLASEPGAELRAVRSVLGDEIPVMGGYTFGQFFQDTGSKELNLLYQHILIVLFAG
jgi:hypothetical protein